MADLILIRFRPVKSAVQRRSLVTQLRDAARSAVPEQNPGWEIGPVNHGRFKIQLPGGEGTVDSEGAHFFDLDEPDFSIVTLIYDLARAGDMAMVESGGPAGAILFDRSQARVLPAEFRRPKPVLCTSAAHLARLLGVSTKPARAPAKLHKRFQWSHDHDTRYRGRLHGLREDPQERYIYLQVLPGETEDSLQIAQGKYIRQSKTKVPDGGNIGTVGYAWELRLPSGEVFIALRVVGYSWKANSDHGIPSRIEAWLRIARAFARASKRQCGTIVGGKTFVLDNGRRYPLRKLESRLAPPDES